MYSLFLIAINNIKKKKSDVAVLFFLIILATLLLYASISILTNTSKVIDKKYEEFNTADFFYMTGSKDAKIIDVFTRQEEVEEVEKTDSIYLFSTKYYSEKTKEKEELSFILGAMEEENKICRIPAIDEDKKQYQSILLPYYLNADGSYEIGDKIYLTLGNHEYEFEVLGFVEDPLFATPLNVSIYKCYITKDCMNDILEKETALENSLWSEYKVKLRKGESSVDFEDKIMPILTRDVSDLSNYINYGLNYESMKGGDAILSNIAMGVILVFSILLILIALIVIRFSVHNFIEENLKNIGILQASGYTSAQLKLASVMEMACITLAGTFIGILAGNISGGFVGSLQASMIGIRWEQEFDRMAAAISVFLVFSITIMVTFSVSRIYGRITVLDALRGGIHTHNFRKNYLSFETCLLPKEIILGCKSILSEKAKNISILCILVFLGFTGCVAFSLYQNFVLDNTMLLKLTGIERGLAIVNGENTEQIGKEAEKWDEINKVLYYDLIDINITYGNKQETVPCDVWKEPSQLEYETVVVGRLPKYENEIVLTTSISERLGATVGDVVYVKGSGEKKDYIVSGIDQKINNMGLKALMTSEGQKRLNGQKNISMIYLFTKEGVSFKEIEKRLLDEFSHINVIDVKKQTEASLSGVSMGMMLICVVFLTITILIVSMVVVLLVKGKVMRERKNYGIYKALGFTTGQLILQTIMSNLPVISLGAVLGAIFAVFLIDPLVTTSFAFCGIRKCNMEINPVWPIVTVIGIVLITISVSFLCSLKIRKIEPVKMLMEE